MQSLLNAVIGIIYFLALLFLALIVVASFRGIGIWTRGADGVAYAWQIPFYLRIISSVLLLLFLSGGIYFLWLRFSRLS